MAITKKINGFKVNSCEYIEVSDLVPEEWKEWFFGFISEDAPFSWGDNNRTMVDVGSFADHCERRLENAVDDGFVTESAVERWLKKIRVLDTGADAPYVDLEN